MNNKETFDTYVKHGILKQDDDLERIRTLVNRLIDSLYVPTEEHILFQVDAGRLELLKVDGSEPINWGDLKCIEVSKDRDGNYLVTIDEAAPDDCQSLCDYIIKYMKAWGWEVMVQTEW